MANEFNALLLNSTWTLVPSSHATNIVPCKWIFRTKYFADGTLECQNEWLVGKSYSLQSSIDYDETFSLVVKPTTIRLVLPLVVVHD